MDINQLVRESYKNTATAFMEEQFRESESDYSTRQVEALEEIARNTLERVKVSEKELEALRELSDSLKKRVTVAEQDAERAKKDSKTATRLSCAALIISALTFLFQFMPQIICIISQWIK